MASPELVQTQRLFDGEQRRYRHQSSATRCTMTFSVYLPPSALAGERVPALYFLSGLTCTDENFSTKSGAQRVAAQLGLALIIPDTSPRGEGVADDPEGAYDLGLGAGFYLNATQQPWAEHYQMERYIIEELPEIVEALLPLTDKRAISGHSMGGHGALTLALRHPDRFASASAFSPIVNPIKAPWGVKAFTAYLGEDRDAWRAHDTCELLRERGAPPFPMRVDQGGADNFLKEQLLTDNLREVCDVIGFPAEVHIHAGYDHSYYFISTFIEAHLRFHAEALGL